MIDFENSESDMEEVGGSGNDLNQNLQIVKHQF